MIVISAPGTEPVTLAEVKAQIGIPTGDTDQDTLITRRIGQARAWCEQHTRRSFITQTLELRLDSFPLEIELPAPPLLAVSSVKYIDTDGVEQTVSSGDYDVDTYNTQARVRPVWGGVWPTPRSEPNAVRVQYTAGYGPATTDVPDLIRESVLLLVGHWMNFQPQAENGLVLSRVPFSIRDILDTFKVERYLA